MYVCDPRTGKVETGGSDIQGHPQPYKEFEASLGCLRPCLKNKNGVLISQLILLLINGWGTSSLKRSEWGISEVSRLLRFVGLSLLPRPQCAGGREPGKRVLLLSQIDWMVPEAHRQNCRKKGKKEVGVSPHPVLSVGGDLGPALTLGQPPVVLLS